MPELPEVETIRQDLRQKILNTKIVQVVVYNKKSVGGENPKFVRALVGNSFNEIDRRGKLMIFRLKRGGQSILAHLKMTGQLIYERERRNKIEVIAGGHKLSESDIDVCRISIRGWRWSLGTAAGCFLTTCACLGI